MQLGTLDVRSYDYTRENVFCSYPESIVDELTLTGEPAARLAQAVLESDSMEVFCGIPMTALRKGILTELHLAGQAIGDPGALVL